MESNLKIGDYVYYKASEDDIKFQRDNLRLLYGYIAGGLNEPNIRYGLTPLGEYNLNVYNLMERSSVQKIKLEVIEINPITVRPLLVYETDNTIYYFPKFIHGSLYDKNDNYLE